MCAAGLRVAANCRPEAEITACRQLASNWCYRHEYARKGVTPLGRHLRRFGLC